MPEFYEERGSFKVIFRNTSEQVSGQQKSGQQNKKINKYKQMVLEFCIVPKSSKEISEYLKIKSRPYISSYIIKPLIKEEKLEYTNKKSINAKNQKYITKK